ncbi:MAG TPA: glycosyltransferase family 2 protein [Tardiphaga sp.]
MPLVDFPLAQGSGRAGDQAAHDRAGELPGPRPAFSAVIPAHNEGTVLARCLDALLAGSNPGDLEIVVAANGCTDRTVEIARSYGDRVIVVEVLEASKHAALNAGDAAATVFPRVYLDADITVSAAAIRSVIDEMERTGALVGAPRAVIDLDGASAIVRSFYRVWCEMPWFTENLVGSGIYVLSAAGHARLGAFPAITNDDQYVHDLFEVRERVTSKAFRFLVRPPHTVEGLIKRRTRTLLGQRELHERFGQLPGRARRISLMVLLRQRRINVWDLMVYAFVAKMAAFAAFRKVKRGDRSWERDETSRTAPPAIRGQKEGN